ncbi:hypothetical protein D3C75_751120 [compost metagenome]
MLQNGGDGACGLTGLLRQLADFRSNHGEAPAAFSGPCRFNGCIQRQQIGLGGDSADQPGNLRDFLCPGRQLADLLRGLVDFVRSCANRAQGPADNLFPQVCPFFHDPGA